MTTFHPRFAAEDARTAPMTNGARIAARGAIAAICGLTLDELRPHMGDFEGKRYTNPTLMWQVLNSVGARFKVRVGQFGAADLPGYGLARVQWEGPWTQPGVPMRAQYRHTHWIGAAKRPTCGGGTATGIFDINAIANGSGWCALQDWERILVPWLLEECVPRANGRWHFTHVVEVER